MTGADAALVELLHICVPAGIDPRRKIFQSDLIHNLKGASQYKIAELANTDSKVLKPARSGAMRVRFCREMDGDTNTPSLSFLVDCLKDCYTMVKEQLTDEI